MIRMYTDHSSVILQKVHLLNFCSFIIPIYIDASFYPISIAISKIILHSHGLNMFNTKHHLNSNSLEIDLYQTRTNYDVL